MNSDGKPDGGEKEGRTQLMLYFLPKQAASRGGDGRVSLCPPQPLHKLYVKSSQPKSPSSDWHLRAGRHRPLNQDLWVGGRDS